MYALVCHCYRPAACAVLALSKTLAMEAADAECHQLVILEANLGDFGWWNCRWLLPFYSLMLRWYHQCQARAQVRRASAEAADKAAMELSSSFAQKVPKLPHIKKTWQKISWVDFFEVILCFFFCVPTLENEHHPLPEKDISSPNVRRPPFGCSLCWLKL